MKLGLLTDIHERVEDLHLALAACDRLGAERIVCLGDVCEVGRRLAETVAVLADRGIEGVWGNHDFGLCSHPSAEVSPRRERYEGPVLDYLGTYRPSLTVADCHLSHVEPFRDLSDIMGLWHFGPLPTTAELTAPSFAAVPQRVLFTGHRHRWFLATPAGDTGWDGKSPITLTPPGRYLVVVQAVCEGGCAVYDTDTGVLTPVHFRGSGRRGSGT